MEQLTITRLFPFEPENAASMAAYMKNQFPFCGVPSPERRRLEKPFLTASRQWALPELVATVAAYYRQPEREYQYFAIDLAQHNLKRLTWETWETGSLCWEKNNGGIASTLGGRSIVTGAFCIQNS